ncbi:LITAF domain-containing protein-like [Ptychodera flava]|uniref:LITAF domain-containing protein-like n=1 Tax=Ptychodera flava TaxID=63121 RepID=UPI00396AA452
MEPTTEKPQENPSMPQDPNAPPPYPSTAFAAPPQPVAYTSQPTAINVMHTPVIATPIFRDIPVRTSCANCRSDIVTRTEFEVGSMVWISCFVAVIFGLWLGCCLIPFCIPALKDVVHYCPNCNNVCGKFVRLH